MPAHGRDFVLQFFYLGCSWIWFTIFLSAALQLFGWSRVIFVFCYRKELLRVFCALVIHFVYEISFIAVRMLGYYGMSSLWYEELLGFKMGMGIPAVFPKW